MTDSKRVCQTIRMRIDRLIDGIIERLAQKVLSRLGFDTNKGSPMACFQGLLELFLVQPLGLICHTF